jgi:hypothetical protein
VFNAAFNNISVISWWSGLLVKETRVPVLYHIALYRSKNDVNRFETYKRTSFLLKEMLAIGSITLLWPKTKSLTIYTRKKWKGLD